MQRERLRKALFLLPLSFSPSLSLPLFTYRFTSPFELLKPLSVLLLSSAFLCPVCSQFVYFSPGVIVRFEDRHKSDCQAQFALKRPTHLRAPPPASLLFCLLFTCLSLGFVSFVDAAVVCCNAQKLGLILSVVHSTAVTKQFCPN